MPSSEVELHDGCCKFSQTPMAWEVIGPNSEPVATVTLVMLCEYDTKVPSEQFCLYP